MIVRCENCDDGGDDGVIRVWHCRVHCCCCSVVQCDAAVDVVAAADAVDAISCTLNNPVTSCIK